MAADADVTAPRRLVTSSGATCFPASASLPRAPESSSQIVSTFAGAARRTISACRALPANRATAPESPSSQRAWSGDEVS